MGGKNSNTFVAFIAGAAGHQPSREAAYLLYASSIAPRNLDQSFISFEETLTAIRNSLPVDVRSGETPETWLEKVSKGGKHRGGKGGKGGGVHFPGQLQERILYDLAPPSAMTVVTFCAADSQRHR